MKGILFFCIFYFPILETRYRPYRPRPYMLTTFSKFGELRGIIQIWGINKSCTLWVLNSIHTSRFKIVITNILYKI